MRLLVLLSGALLLLAACDSSGGTSSGSPDTAAAPDTASGPDTASVSDTAAAPDTGTEGSGVRVDHTSVARFAEIPAAAFDLARERSVFYGHTSHGSQLTSGLGMLYAESNDYRQPTIVEVSGDLGHNGDLAWAETTREALGERSYDVVMWSWCGGVSDNDEAGIDAYLEEMSALERAYPETTFVYMTGHTDGTGAEGTLRRMNQRIRDTCAAQGKVLYDFEDIESWDPAGVYYPDIADDCAWCSTWCAENTCPDCDYCAHSHCFNCYQKGQALWVLLARLAGWEP